MNQITSLLARRDINVEMDFLGLSQDCSEWAPSRKDIVPLCLVPDRREELEGEYNSPQIFFQLYILIKFYQILVTRALRESIRYDVKQIADHLPSLRSPLGIYQLLMRNNKINGNCLLKRNCCLPFCSLQASITRRITCQKACWGK